jgi:hypothetical protein
VDIEPVQFYLMNLSGEAPKESPFFVSKEEARRNLIALSGEDFGMDIERWREWFRSNKVGVPPDHHRTERIRRRKCVSSDVSATVPSDVPSDVSAPPAETDPGEGEP